MSVAILISTPLRRYVGGQRRVEVEGITITDALGALATAHPDLRAQIFDDAGSVRCFVNVFVGDTNVRDLAPDGGPIALRGGDVITLIPAIAGGATAPAGAA